MWLAGAGDVDLRCAIGIVGSNIDLWFNLSDNVRSASTGRLPKGSSCMKGQIRPVVISHPDEMGWHVSSRTD